MAKCVMAGVAIDHVSQDPDFATHPIPQMFGFESYFSIPVNRVDGNFFGTLCGLDPQPARLREPKTLDMLKLFATAIPPIPEHGNPFHNAKIADLLSRTLP